MRSPSGIKAIKLVRGKRDEHYDGRRDVYVSLYINEISVFAPLNPEDIEHLRATLAEFDASDPDKAEATTEAAE